MAMKSISYRTYSMSRLETFILTYSKLQIQGIVEPINFELGYVHFRLFGEPSYKFWKLLRILENEEYVI